MQCYIFFLPSQSRCHSLLPTLLPRLGVPPVFHAMGLARATQKPWPPGASAGLTLSWLWAGTFAIPSPAPLHGAELAFVGTQKIDCIPHRDSLFFLNPMSCFWFFFPLPQISLLTQLPLSHG